MVFIASNITLSVVPKLCTFEKSFIKDEAVVSVLVTLTEKLPLSTCRASTLASSVVILVEKEELP